jgi:flagellar hook-basal body complex protein FliE
MAKKDIVLTVRVDDQGTVHIERFGKTVKKVYTDIKHTTKEAEKASKQTHLGIADFVKKTIFNLSSLSSSLLSSVKSVAKFTAAIAAIETVAIGALGALTALGTYISSKFIGSILKIRENFYLVEVSLQGILKSKDAVKTLID